jgi:transcriptional regulator
VLIHEHDSAHSDDEWRSFVDAQRFGHLIASGRHRDLPLVVPTQFVLRGDEMLIHLARPNPIWAAIEENPNVLMSVAGDWAFIPSSFKVINDEDPKLGIPTTYYASVQLSGVARIIDEPAEIAEVLRVQLGTFQPTEDVVDPTTHASHLKAIRGLRVAVKDVRAKFKYGGNVDAEHRAAVADRLRERGGPGDDAALAHLKRRER